MEKTSYNVGATEALMAKLAELEIINRNTREAPTLGEIKRWLGGCFDTAFRFRVSFYRTPWKYGEAGKAYLYSDQNLVSRTFDLEDTDPREIWLIAEHLHQLANFAAYEAIGFDNGVVPRGLGHGFTYEEWVKVSTMEMLETKLLTKLKSVGFTPNGWELTPEDIHRVFTEGTEPLIFNFSGHYGESGGQYCSGMELVTSHQGAFVVSVISTDDNETLGSVGQKVRTKVLEETAEIEHYVEELRKLNAK